MLNVTVTYLIDHQTADQQKATTATTARHVKCTSALPCCCNPVLASKSVRQQPRKQVPRTAAVVCPGKPPAVQAVSQYLGCWPDNRSAPNQLALLSSAGYSTICSSAGLTAWQHARWGGGPQLLYHMLCPWLEKALSRYSGPVVFKPISNTPVATMHLSAAAVGLRHLDCPPCPSAQLYATVRTHSDQVQ